MSDQLHVFVFENVAVRGALVQLGATWRHIRSLREYPRVVESLLGESVVAAVLLASTLKTGTGSLLMQMQGDGALSLLVAECSGDFGLRCTARWNEGIRAEALPALLGNGRCAITLGGSDGRPHYQGIVPLAGTTLATTIESYMGRSEQLDTRIMLFADPQAASGLLLQRVPERHDADADGWNRVIHLGSTVTAAELRDLPAPTLLRRLFPEDDVRLFSGRALRFACSCTSARVRGMLQTLGANEVEAIIAEQGQVEVTCEFCGQRYAFTPDESRRLFAAQPDRDPS